LLSGLKTGNPEARNQVNVNTKYWLPFVGKFKIKARPWVDGPGFVGGAGWPCCPLPVATAKVKVTLQANVGGPALALLLYKHPTPHAPLSTPPKSLANGSLTHCACRLLRRPSPDLRFRHALCPPPSFSHSRGYDYSGVKN